MGVSYRTTHIGPNIAYHRARLGLSQAQVAARMGVSVMTVSKWQSGKLTPNVGRLIGLSGVFEVGLGALLQPPPADPETLLAVLRSDDI